MIFAAFGHCPMACRRTDSILDDRLAITLGRHETPQQVNFVLTDIRICFKSLLREGGATSGHRPDAKSAGCVMAKADLGLKRTCLSCGMRFYDFNRTPIICPGCQTEFDPEAVIRSRRGRSVSRDTQKESKQAEKPVLDDVVEVDDAEEEDETSNEAGSEETGDGMGFEEADINVNEDDSAGLIGNDLDEDEEIIPGVPKEDE
ncbi:MAG: TIGR02300 family protein [Candidatus Puniceispirillaceae bacterium]